MMRSLLGKFWLACAGGIILLAVLLSVARVLLPHVDRYRGEVEQQLGAALGQDIRIGRLAAEWRGLGPRLVMHELRIGSAEAGGESRFERAEVELDVLRSLMRRTVYLRHLLVAGLRLTAQRTPEGTIEVAGMSFGRERAIAATGAHWSTWLFTQGRFSVEDSELLWIDRSDPELVREYRFDGIEFDARSAQGRHQLEGRLKPPPQWGDDAVRFALDLQLPAAAPWRAELWLDGERLRPAAWPAPFGGMRVTGGEGDASLWLVWEGGELRSADLQTALRGLTLTADRPVVDEAVSDAVSEDVAPADPRVFSAAAVSGSFAWRRTAQGWRLDGGDLVFGGEGEPRVPGRFAVAAIDDADAESDTKSDAKSDTGALILARMDALELGPGLRLLALSRHAPAFLADAVEGLRPRGLARDVEFALRSGASPHFDLQAGFEGVGGEPWAGVPGLSGVGGRLRMDERGGEIDLQAGDSAPAFDGLFRAALPAARFDVRLDWERQASAWKLLVPAIGFANDDISFDARGEAQWPLDGGAPEVELSAQFQAATVERISSYLPVGVMPAGTVRWIDRSVRAGKVPRGELILRGRLSDFPFRSGEGLFRVDFDLREGLLEYAGNWPPVEDITAKVVFEGQGMRVAATGGRMLGAQIGATQVAIADLRAKPALLTVRGEAHAPAGEALRFLRETPLADRFGGYAREVEAEGRTRLDLALDLPFGGTTKVSGTLTFDEGALLLADGKVDITNIQGPLRFSGDGLAAEGVTARILGLPATVRIGSSGDGTLRQTRIEARGVAGAQDVAALLRVPGDWFEGNSAWQAQLVVPAAEEIRTAGMPLHIESTLEGMAIALPEPLSKPAADVLPLRVQMRLPRASDRPLALALGDRLALALAMTENGAIERGALQFGAGEARFGAEPGVAVGGQTGRFSLSGWQRVLAAAGDRAGIGDAASLPAVRIADLGVGRVEAFGRFFHDARLSASSGEAGWTLDMDSRELAGRIEIPPRAGLPWRAELTHLHLAAPGPGGSADDEGSVDPRALPALRISSERFSYDGRELGRLQLNASPRAAGMRLDQFALNSPVMNIDARGDWVRVGEEQFSSFNIEFSTDDFGRALGNFGYADSIKGGKGQSTIAARWRGPPTAFALDRLHGSMDIVITNGRLLEVEPGAGRIFGLISLQALPRRLTLDFSDFFGKGFGFDRISGSFAVRDGLARTEDLVMTGPAARIEARGDIDLAGRTYDQSIVVVPSVGSGLPLAAMVVGGAPIGAAMLLMERLFKDNIERITRMHYRVKGPWHDPLIERLQDSDQSGKR
jgi:uncharacterized protein (TIGR02099 family)